MTSLNCASINAPQRLSPPKDFAYVVSHDLKAPLRGIRRLASWLTDDYVDTLDDKGREMATLLIDRVNRMDTLIDGILHYSVWGV